MEMKNRKPAEPRPPSRATQSTQKSDATLGGEIRGKIGHQLRAMYDDVLAQGVPDRFRELLERLDKQDKK
jgi:hypothetical protein